MRKNSRFQESDIETLRMIRDKAKATKLSKSVFFRDNNSL